MTATPEPVTPTPELAAATAAPTAVALQPTTAPTPTAIRALAPGEWVKGEIIRKTRIYDIPNEHEGREVINAEPGTLVRVLYRGGQWYHIGGETTGGKIIDGWVYKDWIRIAPEDEARLQSHPQVLPVIVSKITQTVGRDGKKYWAGTVMNIGAKTAYDAAVEISIRSQVGDTETLADRGTAFVTKRNLEPGQSARFTVQTAWITDRNVFYSHEVRWTEK
ncbi:MAG: hypothetical protein ACP5MJ_04310 [Roseiflexus sp.]